MLILQGRLQCPKSIPQGYSTPGQQLGSRPPPCSTSSAAVRDWLREENRHSHLRALRPPVSVVYEHHRRMRGSSSCSWLRSQTASAI